ncbi:MAG: citrate/2-methylcitrate synthase [Planctomycetota bacterium]|nr:citrate/2-methylcitrate synthase [Planctomycetota bacterium]
MSTSSPTVSQGLAGIIAGDSAICSVEQDKLIYRGYDIDDLADNATFEEVAHLLLVGHKPSAAEAKAFDEQLKAARALPQDVTELVTRIAKAPYMHPMDVVRTAVSYLGHYDKDCQDNSAEAELRKSIRLTAQIATIIGHMQNAIDGKAVVKPDNSLGHAANLLYMMRGEKPTKEEEKIIDVSLILYAEHDFNASTFTGRVIAGTLADLHGAVTGAIAALKGPLHGGANEAAMDMLKEIGTAGNVEPFMKKAFAEKRKVMGFGHRVYKHGDHRASILHGLGRAYADKKGKEAQKWFEIGEKVQKIMSDEKGIFPNVDFPCGMTYYVMGIPVPQYTPIFVAARITGWAAHIMEQHADKKLIRPLSNYTGPMGKKW